MSLRGGEIVLHTDRLLGLLANERRRLLLDTVRTEGTVRVDTDDPQRQLELYHIHLPKLEAADLIEWNRDAETITSGPRFAEVEPLLQFIEGLPESPRLDSTS